MHYRLLISIEVVEFLEKLPLRVRTPLRRAIEAVGNEPLAMADATDYDVTGRKLHIAIVTDFALIYWIDDADQQVKILDLHAADR